MKNIKWLLELANSKPLIFSLAILLIAVGTLSTVIINRDRKIDDCNFEKKNLQNYYEARVDSLTSYYRKKEDQQTKEIKETLNSIIDTYKEQLEEQRKVNSKISTTIRKNRTIIKKNKDQIKTLTDEK